MCRVRFLAEPVVRLHRRCITEDHKELRFPGVCARFRNSQPRRAAMCGIVKAVVSQMYEECVLHRMATGDPFVLYSDWQPFCAV